MATAIKRETEKQLVIEQTLIARPVRRSKFDIADWRRALEHAEALNGNRVDLYDLYEDVLLDPHLSTQIGKRIANITHLEWQLEVNKEKQDDLDTLCKSPQFETILTEIMQAQFFGKTLLELGKKKITRYGKEEYVLDSYSVKRQHIRPKEGVIVHEQYNSASASTNTLSINYREPMYANYLADIGSDTDLGLILKAVPYVLLKRGDIGDWAQFVQLFGMPFREYRYNGYDDATYELLKKNAEDMGSAPYIILPDGATLTIHDNKISGTGAGDVYEKLARFCDEQISILILGNTETTNSSKSSGYAQSETHMKTQLEVYRDDVKYVTNWLNDIVRPILYNLGYTVAEGIFKPEKTIDLKEVKEKLTILQQVKALGEPIDSDHVYEVSGVPKPADYDAQKAAIESEKHAQQQSNQASGGGKKPMPKKKTEKLSSEQSLLDRIRVAVADFFDPAQ